MSPRVSERATASKSNSHWTGPIDCRKIQQRCRPERMRGTCSCGTSNGHLMQSRRTFVHSLLGAGVAAPVMRGDAFTRLFRAGEVGGALPAAQVAADESYWNEIQRAFDLDRTMVHLNNGGRQR